MAIIYSSKPLQERREHDYYPTPIELARASLKLLDYTRPLILDPGAGTGIWGVAAKEIWPESTIFGVEIQDIEKPEEYEHWLNNTDFMEFSRSSWPFGFNFVMGNPPFKFSHQFLEQSLDLVFPKTEYLEGGEVLFLLPLSFLESQKRYTQYFSKGLNPKEVYVSTRRVSFRGDKKSDNTAYAVYRWQRDWHGDTTLKWLDWSYDE